MKATHNYDLIILGGGPAGLTAGIYAARAKLRAIVLESNITGGLVNSTHTVENFPSWPAIHGMELMEKMREHLDSLYVPVEEVCEVEALELDGPLKRAVTDGADYTAKAVILATGRRPLPLNTPTEADEIHYCSVCDGSPYAGKHVLVVGGGNSAFDESLYLLGLGVSRITLVECMDRFFAAQSAQDTLLGTGKVTAHTATTVRDVCLRNGKLCAVHLEHKSGDSTHATEVAVDGVFVFLGQQPNNALFAGQVELTEQGYIAAGPDMSTNLPGVFGAGDINHKQFRQITTAMADGTVAALAAERFIRTN